VRYIVYDAETRSALELGAVGSHRYACGQTTDVWCVSYCIVTDDARGPISTWLMPDPAPAEILAATADPQTLIVAHGDAFEHQIEQHIVHPRYGWPLIPLERRRCTQAIALSHALPAALEKIAGALQLKLNKPPKGKAAMRKLARPRKPRKGEDPDGTYWHDDPKLFELLYAYNRIDVEIATEIVRQLGFLPPDERRVWEMDATINARGIGCDVELLDAARGAVEQAVIELQRKVTELTGGGITSIAQRDRALVWLAQHGCTVPDLQKKTLLGAL
jgi:DNA polymerase